jgi:phosphoserine phosphatase RsbU/P
MSRGSVFQSRAVGYVAAIAGIAIVAAVCALLRSYINEMTVALAMLLVVLFVATEWEYWPALVASVLGMVCLNYLFLPPIYMFTIEDPKNWVALTAFLMTALTAGRLSAWAKQKAAEAEVGSQEAQVLARLQGVVAELGQHVLRSEPSQKVFEEAVVRAAQTLKVDNGRVLELLPGGKTLLLRAGFGWKPGVVGQATVSAGPETQAGFALLSKEPVILEDIRTETRFRSVPMFGDAEMVSGMSVVISTSEAPYGVFSVHTRQRRTFTTDEVNFLQAVANVLGTMIERQRAEEALRKSAHEIGMLANLQSVVADLGERALQGASLSQMFDDAANQVTRALDVDYSKVLQLLANRDALLMIAGTGWKPGCVGHATVGMGTDSQAGYTLLCGLPVIVEDLAKEKRFSGTALLHEYEVVSGATVAIPTKEGAYGVLGAHTRRRKAFRSDEINFLQAVANVLGSTIEHHRAEAQLWRVNQAQRVLSKCNQGLIRATEESALLQRICDLIVEEAGYRFCWVGRAENDEPKSVLPIAQAGFAAGYLDTLNITWADTEQGRGPTGTSIRTRETVVMKHFASDPRMAPWRAEAIKRGYASSVAIPLVFDSTVFGAIMIYSAEDGAFADEEVALLTELASDLAFGIQTLRTREDRARAETALREREEHVRLLLDSTAEAICGVDPEGNCTWVNQACLEMLGYSDPSAVLGKNLHSMAHYAEPDGTSLPQERCHAYRALREGEYVHEDGEVMWRADGTPFPVEYWSHPLRRNGHAVGAVFTFLDVTDRKRAESEVRTLNAELEQRVIRRTAELEMANQALGEAHEREIGIGFRIQQTLLLDPPPANLPGLRVAAITLPSQRIDGDFYAFFKHQDDSLDVIVGDVMGKGVPAALLGAATKSQLLKAISHLLALSGTGNLPEAKEIVSLAHSEVVRQLIDLDSFVTLCYARLDSKRRMLSLVDCGHTGTIQWHAGTGLCQVLHGDNLPLGVSEGEIYDQISVPFELGDLFLFYSDGITEARNGGGDLFGVERLEECVRRAGELEPEALVEGIRKAVAAFSGSNRLSDDLTCVVVRAVAHAEMDLRSDLRELRRAREFVTAFCREVPGPPLGADSVSALELAVHEAGSNIIKHAYHGRTDEWIHVEGEAFPGQVSIRLRHRGEEFNPLAVPPPAFDGSRESGFGTYIISRSVDDVRYYRDESGRSCIALVKNHRLERGSYGSGNGESR